MDFKGLSDIEKNFLQAYNINDVKNWEFQGISNVNDYIGSDSSIHGLRPDMRAVFYNRRTRGMKFLPEKGSFIFIHQTIAEV